MAQFHFVEDYERYVNDLVEKYPIDEAMARAVGGGHYDGIGRIELNILKHAGLQSGMAVFDLGCGSGRLATALGDSGMDIRYIGTDVVQALLDYARTKSPAHYQFIRHAQLSIPKEDESLDIFCAFSVFTHLLHHETYRYLEDAHRALKPGGLAVFSFLEYADPAHWDVFEYTLDKQKKGEEIPLNMFIERNVIEKLAEQTGFTVSQFLNGWDRVNDGDPLGQSVCVLKKPA
ncbi:class I SAM-dependent methyltransferase [Paraburkholderia atlantica]|uniref:class I SAM-dependent methyltransferase n=1 Tax=Paraburkholderia atlantica TaxID=2654982 RepID=UPI001620A0F7|nr:class I SAM-dependent methyltransferase [Paraburkholderia atlantica]MBB5508169.1 ubiquinone/menaquinone biosynthesis C-methylase UbiE [Paraburkholderia atlantica]